MEVLLYLVLIILSTKVAGDLSVRIGQPAVLGKLIAGIVLGPAILGWIHPDAFISHFSEIGVLLLMFIAGLETDLDKLRENWKASFAVALGGIMLPFIGGYTVSIALGLSNTHSLFIGLLLCATSVSISVQTLKEMNRLDSKEGTTILGAAVVDDVIVVVLLAVMMSVLGPGGDVSLAVLIFKKVLFLVAIIVAGWFLVPFFMKLIAPFRISEAVTSAALIVCFAFSYFAETMGVAGIIGAFAGGIAISQTAYNHDVGTKIEPIAYTLFVPVFFVSIGLNITFTGLGNHIWFILLMTVIAVATKMLGGGLGARLTGFDLISSLAIGSGMVSRGEVALIIGVAGLESGLLLEKYFTSIVMVIILTTLITPPMLKLFFSRINNLIT
ncbi:monovalent cation:proton antiporter-2 (CPA2) family protein [Paenibacillus taihuensis]|uniref:Monovalent cation:proton antiporter-2 (CPA2) family protein n=1 Tax=Paenibacillus taihuensis TaxID=1156355 RepID=A0A3D9RHX0_9BACL|nr:monovalent cation:proton antiporter-2 (CPA2) family protein [Paenibacillus taihuensis]REE78566.1 monovalent cation:proton antiporter-2 (CPA2) family protein [Paenibacillus taihuensis]